MSEEALELHTKHDLDGLSHGCGHIDELMALNNLTFSQWLDCHLSRCLNSLDISSECCLIHWIIDQVVHIQTNILDSILLLALYVFVAEAALERWIIACLIEHGDWIIQAHVLLLSESLSHRLCWVFEKRSDLES